jgi:hypothetical protein
VSAEEERRESLLNFGISILFTKTRDWMRASALRVRGLSLALSPHHVMEKVDRWKVPSITLDATPLTHAEMER